MPKIVKTDAEWLEQLGDLAFRVTRQHATERAFSHDEFYEGNGSYRCVCCGAELFTNAERFDSGCGWPAFTAPVGKDVIDGYEDRSHGMHRVEVRCHQCDAHLGHVFPDGPRDRGGLRYCINGVALDYTPDAKG